MRHASTSLALAALLVSAVSVAAEAPPSTCCASLEEVRMNIDRIDAEILELMAERGTYVAQAAKFKPSAAAVHDGARVERIIARVRAAAAERGLSPDVAEATWRAMIAAFTDYEKTLVKP
jgi:isochorismate pyruvate lyase